MLSGDEIFFDTNDQLLSENFVGNENLLCSDLDYDIWLREPQSVNYRRSSFLSKMGFVEPLPVVESEAMRLEEDFESNTSESTIDEKLLSERRESNSEANCSDQDWLKSMDVERGMYQGLVSDPKCENGHGRGKQPKKVMHWWKQFTRSMTKNQRCKASSDAKTARMSVSRNKKSFIECTGVYSGQEIKAHEGRIWAMKFSPDGKYLASGGEDGVVCIWRVGLFDASIENGKYSFSCRDNLSPQKKKPIPIIMPEKIFRIEEELVQNLKGHSSGVLDLAWSTSTSNHLLSSSMDKTVRLWRVGSDECLGVFHHNDYVTCVQFNPMDENRFISGSIDGKVRIWGLYTQRVKDWANIGDLVTAVCYQPNGKGFIVGTVSGNCRFYELSENEILLNAELKVQGRKKLTGNKITGIQFLKEDSQRVMITSDDSKIRILDGLDVVCKYRGLAKSGSQMSASFTSSGRHIISVGEDTRVYLWNYDNICIQTPKQVKSIRSCEYFFSEGVSIALPWSPPNYDHQDASSSVSNSERFSLANWFSMESLSRTTVTWPEEKLPSFHLPSAEIESEASSAQLSGPWGLVFVTANWDGTIRTYHNYGLPVRK